MTNDIKNAMLDSGFGTGASSGTWVSLHNGDPTTTVATALANEAAGAPYGRVQLNLAAAAAGAKALAANAVVSIQAGDTFSHYADSEVLVGTPATDGQVTVFATGADTLGMTPNSTYDVDVVAHLASGSVATIAYCQVVMRARPTIGTVA